MTAKERKKMSKSYVKMMIMNNIIEFIEYEKLNVNGKPPDIAYRVEKGQGQDIEENYNRTQKKRRDVIRRLVTQNFTNTESKFITLTFAENIQDVKQANKEFHKFIKRIKRRYLDFKYLSVIEFQDKHDRGAVHYHMICNLPYIKALELKELWQNGFVKINMIKNVDNVGAYVVKYMNKDIDDKRLQGLKAYNCSKGLERPQEVTSWNNGEETIKILYDKYGLNEKKAVYQAEYTSQNAGKIVYKQFNFNRK